MQDLVRYSDFTQIMEHCRVLQVINILLRQAQAFSDFRG